VGYSERRVVLWVANVSQELTASISRTEVGNKPQACKDNNRKAQNANFHRRENLKFNGLIPDSEIDFPNVKTSVCLF
jgi:hypothetical protein